MKFDPKKYDQLMKELEDKKKKRSHIEKGTMPTFVHFKHIPEPDDPDKKKLNEDLDTEEHNGPEKASDIDGWKHKNDNKNLSAHSDKWSNDRNKQVSKKVSAHHNFTKGQKRAIEHYSGTGSKLLNHSLVRKKALSKTQKHMSIHLDNAMENNPSQHTYHVYSGLGFDPKKHLDEHGHIKSRAYLSMTHNKDTALSFAHNAANRRKKGFDVPRHIAHVQIKKGDHAINIHKHSQYPFENETVLARNTKLKYHGTEVYHDHDYDKPVHVHRFSIARDK